MSWQVDAVSDKDENAEETRDRVIPVLRFLVDTGEFVIKDDEVALQPPKIHCLRERLTDQSSV